MQTNRKIRLLLAGCLLIVAVLSGIQFYLVRNTYELTKRQYYTEVKQALDQLSQPLTDSANSRAMRLLRDQLPGYGAHIARDEFTQIVATAIGLEKRQDDSLLQVLIKRNSLLSAVRFNMSYKQIILIRNEISDTLLKVTDPPLPILGDDHPGPDWLAVSEGSQISSLVDPADAQTIAPLTSRLEVRYEQMANVSDWKQQVWKRMTGVFFLATGLIAALIFLFYQVFRTLLKQKRIADITTDFANNMTHELKTPLSSIAIIIKSMETGTARSQPEMMNELVRSLNRQHQKLQQLTDQVLETALSEQSSPKWEPIRIKTFLQELLQDLKNDTHHIELKVDDGDHLLQTDPQLLLSVAENLLENAVKYSEPGTTILLNAYADAGYCYIEISDQGVGIATTEHNRIFEKFYRVPEQDLHSVKGLGLGLYLCKTKITMLGGTLSVRSQSGKGSTFIIKLPLLEK